MSAPAWERIGKLVYEGTIDEVRFLDTIDRVADFNEFKKQHGPHLAEKVKFLSIGASLYDHVIGNIANHPAMHVEVK